MVQINQSENRNSYSVWNLNNKKLYTTLNHIRFVLINQMISRNSIVIANAKVVGRSIRQSWSQVYPECTPLCIMRSNYDLRVHLKINIDYKSRNRGCYNTYNLKSRRPLSYKPNIWQLQKSTSDKLSCSYLFPSQYRVIEFDKYSWINPSFADHLTVQK